MKLFYFLIFLLATCMLNAQVDNTLDSYEEYLTAIKTDAELYDIHKSANRYMDKAQGYGIASVVFLGLASFGAITVNPDGASDPQPGSLVLMSVGGILGGITGLVAIGSYSKSKSRKSKIRRILDERYGLIDNYSLSIQDTYNGMGFVLTF